MRKEALALLLGAVFVGAAFAAVIAADNSDGAIADADQISICSVDRPQDFPGDIVIVIDTGDEEVLTPIVGPIGGGGDNPGTVVL